MAKNTYQSPVKLFLKAVYWLLILAIFGSVAVLAFDAYVTWKSAEGS